MQSIHTKVPYRIPFVGGFTDFPEFYHRYGGETITCTIDKYITVSIRQNELGGLDIQSRADLSWGVGLGSSGTYNSALISALARLKKQKLPKLAIAKLAYDLETGIEKHSTGRQDSLACLYKGFSKITYCQNGEVKVRPIAVPKEWRDTLNRRLMLFDTGVRRKAGDSIRDILSKDNAVLLKEVATLPGRLIDAWTAKDMDFLGTVLDLQESYRRRITKTCQSPFTDKLLNTARKCGAGARLTGAGLGSLLCYCPEERQAELRKKLGVPQITYSMLW